MALVARRGAGGWWCARGICCWHGCRCVWLACGVTGVMVMLVMLVMLVVVVITFRAFRSVVVTRGVRFYCMARCCLGGGAACVYVAASGC